MSTTERGLAAEEEVSVYSPVIRVLARAVAEGGMDGEAVQLASRVVLGCSPSPHDHQRRIVFARRRGGHLS